VLCVVKDEVDESIDRDLATFVINSHIKNQPHVQKYKINVESEMLPEEKDTRPFINHEFLKEYIKYAREKCRPKLPDKNLDIIKQFYLKLREESTRTGGINIAVRHIESIVRLS
jgi:DNA replication licensing factor MCM2